MLRVTLLIDEAYLSDLPLSKAKAVEIHSDAGPYVPPTGVIYRKGETGQGLVDVDATLSLHRSSREEILSRRWPYGTWQQTVKRAMSRS